MIRKIAHDKTIFLAKMSHEIRTPMTGLIGLLECLEDTKLNESQLSYISSMKSCSNSLITILNDILDITKMEENKLEIYPVETELKSMLRDIKSLFSNRASKNNNIINININSTTPSYILIDEVRTKQILHNLLSNACKFCQNGHININVRYESPYLYITVQDTGIGIPEDKISSLFTPFKQLYNTYVCISNNAGTGLGLSLCKSLANLMEGDIKVESKVGQGSSFTLWIKSDTIQYPTVKVNGKDNSFSNTLDFSGLNILVVEDNKLNQIIVKKLLSKLNIKNVTVKENGEKALQEISTNKHYDVVFMDCHMPVMDGLTSTERIRQLDLTHQPIIIALSANVLQNNKENCLNAGMNDFLSKPIKVKDIINILSKWILSINVSS